ATLIDGKWHRSITNVGIRPTFSQSGEVSIETHVFDFEDNLYNRCLRVRFLHRIRDERKFNGIEDLREQIKKDICRAIRYFSRKGVKNNLNLI
ncbi:MAG: riboflavin kinase, partial [Pyrinomonadaceae bacterium]